MPELNPHISESGVNSHGTMMDLIKRPITDVDPRCAAIIDKVIASVMVAFPKETQNAIEDSIVRAIASADGRFASLNLTKISDDPENMATAGTDGGVFVARRYVNATANAAAGVAGSATLPVPFGDTSYVVSVEPASDPGINYRWWVVSKTSSQVVVGYAAGNNCTLTIQALG